MTQQKADESFENNDSVLKNQAPTPTSEQTEKKTVLDAEVDEKKSFTEKWQTSRFLLVRGSYHVLRSVWMAVMFIGGFIAWLISLLFI